MLSTSLARSERLVAAAAGHSCISASDRFARWSPATYARTSVGTKRNQPTEGI